MKRGQGAGTRESLAECHQKNSSTWDKYRLQTQSNGCTVSASLEAARLVPDERRDRGDGNHKNEKR